MQQRVRRISYSDLGPLATDLTVLENAPEKSQVFSSFFLNPEVPYLLRKPHKQNMYFSNLFAHPVTLCHL